ncbi:MAG: orotidine-5'-phosphate decarboxylase [Gammaproteobacteria bacterium]|nr:orotidine-5'-phosphate decarboxylase [Gammaproteobacteria bacterium]
MNSPADDAVRSPFREQLEAAWERSGGFLCVGLDPDLERVRDLMPGRKGAMLDFCRAIVDATADLVCAFKPQIAFFSASGAEHDLEALIAHIHASHPGVPVILDAKRGDIGSSAAQYAREAFERYGADCVTVNPYVGWEGIEPYRRYPGRGVALLCRTSNPDSGWLQDYPANDPLYLRIARAAAERDEGDLMLVTGAPYPEQLAAAREAAGDLPLLVPGVGTQGGDPAAVLGCVASNGRGLVVSASRSIIYAGGVADFVEAARASAQRLYEKVRIPAPA